MCLPRPKTLKEIEGEGMPGKQGKGSLYIRFNIIFPADLEEERRDELRPLLA